MCKALLFAPDRGMCSSSGIVRLVIMRNFEPFFWPVEAFPSSQFLAGWVASSVTNQLGPELQRGCADKPAPSDGRNASDTPRTIHLLQRRRVKPSRACAPLGIQGRKR